MNMWALREALVLETSVEISWRFFPYSVVGPSARVWCISDKWLPRAVLPTPHLTCEDGVWGIKGPRPFRPPALGREYQSGARCWICKFGKRICFEASKEGKFAPDTKHDRKRWEKSRARPRIRRFPHAWLGYFPSSDYPFFPGFPNQFLSLPAHPVGPNAASRAFAALLDHCDWHEDIFLSMSSSLQKRRLQPWSCGQAQPFPERERHDDLVRRRTEWVPPLHLGRWCEVDRIVSEKYNVVLFHTRLQISGLIISGFSPGVSLFFSRPWPTVEGNVIDQVSTTTRLPWEKFQAKTRAKVLWAVLEGHTPL